MPTIFLGTTGDFDYDAFASIIFTDEAAFNAFNARLQEPDVDKVLEEDHDNFLWKQKLVVAAAGAPHITLNSETA